ncbi:MAG: CYTH domain-containing protein [Elusimicrobia bacterium]|nr:CYTH domain-containing protein [Elusimicrobiota bacterium]
MKSLLKGICRRLGIDDFKHIEIESKKRVLPEDAQELKDYLAGRRQIRHSKKRTFFDQFLDTPDMALLKSGASLRLRYKGDGSKVYLQYKGPGFHKDGLLYRSEFSSQRLERVILEESHHSVVHFTDTTVRDILATQAPAAMTLALRRHLGRAVLSRISKGPILCLYQKEKFILDLGAAFLEPSVDRLFAFHISRSGVHSLSTFWEYENEIKSEEGDLKSKIENISELLKFDRSVAARFDLHPERLDKYRRCASCFVALERRGR